MVLYQLCQEGTLHGVVDELLLRDDAISVSINLVQDVINDVVNLLVLSLAVEHLVESHNDPVDLVVINGSTSV